jgi:hypothetical protein
MEALVVRRQWTVTEWQSELSANGDLNARRTVIGRGSGRRRSPSERGSHGLRLTALDAAESSDPGYMRPQLERMTLGCDDRAVNATRFPLSAVGRTSPSLMRRVDAEARNTLDR